jgi:hypothetical protein
VIAEIKEGSLVVCVRLSSEKKVNAKTVQKNNIPKTIILF